MKALVLTGSGGPDVLKVEERPDPEPGSNANAAPDPGTAAGSGSAPGETRA